MRNCNQMEFLNSMVPTPHGAIIECDAVLAYTITQDPQTLTCTCTNWGSWEKTDPRQSMFPTTLKPDAEKPDHVNTWNQLCPVHTIM